MRIVWALVITCALGACSAPRSSAEVSLPPPMKIAPEVYQKCVDERAPILVRRNYQDKGRNILYGYQWSVRDELMRHCGGKNSEERMYAESVAEKAAEKILDELSAEELAARQKKEADEAPRKEAEKRERDSIGAAYFQCLRVAARRLAVKSNEPADTLAQASIAACLADRRSVLTIYEKHHEFFSEESMKAADSVFRKQLLLEIIEARAKQR